MRKRERDVEWGGGTREGEEASLSYGGILPKCPSFLSLSFFFLVSSLPNTEHRWSNSFP